MASALACLVFFFSKAADGTIGFEPVMLAGNNAWSFLPWSFNFSLHWLLLLSSQLGVNAWTPKCLSLQGFIVSLNTFLIIVLEALLGAFGFIMTLMEFSLEICHLLLEVLHISGTELGHVLLEESFLMDNLVLLLNNLLSNSKLFGYAALESDADVNW